jgi:hypothetical protein
MTTKDERAAYRAKHADKIKAYRESHRAEQKAYREAQKAKRDIGVYEIINTVTHERYVGSTTVGFKPRWAVHKCNLESGDHKCKKLQASYDQHGEDCFVYQVVERCGATQCRISEKEYIKATHPDYILNTRLV